MKFSRPKCEDRVDVSKHVIEMIGMSDALIHHEKNRDEKIMSPTLSSLPPKYKYLEDFYTSYRKMDEKKDERLYWKILVPVMLN